MTRRLCRRPSDASWRRGPGPPPLPLVEVNSEGPKDPRTPPKRALAGPQGPRPDLKAYASAADPSMEWLFFKQFVFIWMIR